MVDFAAEVKRNRSLCAPMRIYAHLCAPMRTDARNFGNVDFSQNRSIVLTPQAPRKYPASTLQVASANTEPTTAASLVTDQPRCDLMNSVTDQPRPRQSAKEVV